MKEQIEFKNLKFDDNSESEKLNVRTDSKFFCFWFGSKITIP